VNRGFILSALTTKIQCTLSTITTNLSQETEYPDSGFSPQSLQLNTRINLKLGHKCYLLHLFQFIFHHQQKFNTTEYQSMWFRRYRYMAVP
jgi:hypothetical protein